MGFKEGFTMALGNLDELFAASESVSCYSVVIASLQCEQSGNEMRVASRLSEKVPRSFITGESFSGAVLFSS